MKLYDVLAKTRAGRRSLAQSRLRYRVLSVLHHAQTESGLTQKEIAKLAEVSKSAVNQAFNGGGNLRVDTIAAYLDAMDCELKVELVKAGTARAKAVDWRAGEGMSLEMPFRRHSGAGRVRGTSSGRHGEGSWSNAGTDRVTASLGAGGSGSK